MVSDLKQLATHRTRSSTTADFEQAQLLSVRNSMVKPQIWKIQEETSRQKLTKKGMGKMPRQMSVSELSNWMPKSLIA